MTVSDTVVYIQGEAIVTLAEVLESTHMPIDEPLDLGFDVQWAKCAARRALQTRKHSDRVPQAR